MRGGIFFVFYLSTIFGINLGFGQTANFSIPANACQEENVLIINHSVADSIFWDFCIGDLNQTPTISNLTTLTDGNTTTGIDIVGDGKNWYGFVTSRSNNLLFRIDFGNNLNNEDIQITNLGNPNNVLSNPQKITIINDSTNWYAFVVNGGTPSFVRIDLGTNIYNNSPLGVVVDSGGGAPLNGFDLVYDDTKWMALLAYNSSVEIIDLGNKLTNIPEAEDITAFSVAGSNLMTDIVVEKYEGNWHGYATSWNSITLHHILFGSTISNSTTVTEISPGFLESNRPTSIYIGGDSSIHQGLISTVSGQTYRLTFSDGLGTTVNIENLGNFGMLTNSLDASYVKNYSSWIGFVLNHTAETIHKLIFNKTCSSEVEYSINELPDRVVFSESGIREIEQRAFSNLNMVNAIENITITSNTAPPITFTDNNNECLGQSNTFTPSNLTLDTYEWSFDNGTTVGSTDPSPSHTFSQTGDSIVILTVNDGTCSNFIKDAISIYPEPVAPTFSTPGAPHCTGADLAFENLFDESNYNGATLTYDWNYNGEGNSNERDGSFAFDSEGTKTITLTASIPGCSTPSAGTDINVIAGPDVGFSFEDLCLEDETQFHNSTTGTGITGQTWNFGDGSGTSSASSPTYSYAAHGNYNVSLTVNNNQGCSNELTLPITIDDKPVASFNHGPACEGVDISFLDESSVDGLANITSYEWNFEGLGNSTDQNPNFTFDSQGSYDVELIVETTAGCRDTATSTVNVLLAPAANFEVDLGCINTETIFLDQSEGDFSNPITQWIWTIDGSLASYSSSFGEVYNEPGEHTVSLLVRSANSCQAISDDSFTISELPVADFTVESACDNEQTIFQDASNSSPLEIASYSWAFDNQGTSTSNPTTHQFTNAGSYTVELSVLDETGCEGSIQKTVTINPSPTAILEVSTDIGPAPLTIDFTNQTQGVVNASYWLFGDDEQSTSSESNPQFVYSVEGDYTSQLITTNDLGCSDTTSIAITVADPILDLELVQISTEESQEKTNITLTVKNSGNVILNGFDIRIDLDNNSSIFESYSGTLTRGEQITYPLNFTFSSVGNNIGYACITLIDRVEEIEDINIVNNEGCIDFDQKLVIEDSYPNPVQNTDTNIRLNMILPADAPVQIFLLDATGSVLYQEVYMDAKAGLNSFFVDIYSFKQGMYFIKTVYDQNESTQRFVKL